MGHLGIFLTILALTAGGVSITYTLNLFQKSRLKYLKIHNSLFIVLNYQILIGTAFNYSQFNLISQLSDKTFTIIKKIYHLHLSITSLMLFFAFIFIIQELFTYMFSQRWKVSFFTLLAVLFLSQALSSFFPGLGEKSPLYILFLLIIFVISDIFPIGVLFFTYLRTVKNKTNRQREMLKGLVIVIGLILICMDALTFLQGFNRISTEFYTILISIPIFFLNILPLKYVRKLTEILFPESHDSKNNHRLELIARYKITPREEEIIKLICQGKSNKEIEEELFISLQTVKDHIYSIYQKTGVKNRVQLANLFH